MEECYLIKEAAAKVGVESHVLRYWEEELKMEIHRNEMGHRYYTQKDIEILSKVRDLKEKGLQLKAIRNYLEMRRKQIEDGGKNSQVDAVRVVAEAAELPEEETEKENPMVEEKEISEKTEIIDSEEENATELVPVQQNVLSNEEKMEQFQQIMNRILSKAIQENNQLIGKTAGEHAANMVVTQMQGMTKEQEARAEARYQKLDQTLREIQRARAEAAATGIRPVDKRKQKRLKRKSGKQDSNMAQDVENNSGKECCEG